jgi:C-terminal processing protease CtpA/Prc
MSDFIIANRPESFFMPWTPGDEFAQWSRLQVAPSGTRYDKPIVALISPNCFSACDTFTAALKSNKLATIAGEGSGGGTGTPLVFSLPISSHQFRYSVVRGLTSDGAPIEGAGTLPDVVIEPTVDERINGRDEQLEKAFSLLRTVPTTPSITKSLPLTWTQRMDIAPTMADEAALREIIHIDEL